MTDSSTAERPSLGPTPSVPSPSLFSLRGKHVLLTGGTRGIGAACALGLAQAGASLCLVVRPPSDADAPASASEHSALSPLPVDAGQQHSVVYADLADRGSVKGVFEAALATRAMDGTIDVLVNCAGIQRRAPSTDFSERDWDEVIEVNLSSVWTLCQAAGRHMVPRRSGKIINFGSLLSYQGGLTVPAYASAKGAVLQLTKALSNEWASASINVNGIAPGYVATDMNARLLADATRLRQISERIPAGRWGDASDFVGPVCVCW